MNAEWETEQRTFNQDIIALKLITNLNRMYCRGNEPTSPSRFHCCSASTFDFPDNERKIIYDFGISRIEIVIRFRD